ncbi:hypothetical protein ACFFSH_10350 [Streptomyces filamentosus]|uniref:Uncharacterized protein n=1 Tax=Streptomyces filamentosus TaxID=67294 RepID=A0A919BH33_STRFL|nr:hypothetical protein [Streptomyces filamentosus]KAA6219222.1 hypothetical protein CP979_21800 [Streptomyces filamentosus]GHF88727.1 hypothetical protein GCM10017667_16850 [Streptomyces filamentosus]
MSQPVPPPGNPFAQGAPQQPDGQNPFGAYPPAPAPRQNNLVLGIVAAVVAALVTAGVYGAIMGGVEVEIGWAAVGVGFAVGFAAGKVGGSNPVLPVISAVLALGAVYLGQLVGIAVFFTKEFDASFADVFFKQFGMLVDLWSETKEPMTFLFLALGPVAAFSGAKKAGQ